MSVQPLMEKLNRLSCSVTLLQISIIKHILAKCDLTEVIPNRQMSYFKLSQRLKYRITGVIKAIQLSE